MRESPTLTMARRSSPSTSTRARATRVVPIPRRAGSLTARSQTARLACSTAATRPAGLRSRLKAWREGLDGGQRRRPRRRRGRPSRRRRRRGARPRAAGPGWRPGPGRCRSPTRTAAPSSARPRAPSCPTCSRSPLRNAIGPETALRLRKVPLVEPRSSTNSEPSRRNTRAWSCDTNVSSGSDTPHPAARPTVSSSPSAKTCPLRSAGSTTTSRSAPGRGAAPARDRRRPRCRQVGGHRRRPRRSWAHAARSTRPADPEEEEVQEDQEDHPEHGEQRVGNDSRKEVRHALLRLVSHPGATHRRSRRRARAAGSGRRSPLTLVPLVLPRSHHHVAAARRRRLGGSRRGGG